MIVFLVLDANYDLEHLPSVARQKAVNAADRLKNVANTESPRITRGYNREMARCSECGRLMEEKDLEEHAAAQHQETEETRTISADTFVSRGDLVDDYHPDWLQEDDERDDILDQLQEPTGGQQLDPEQLESRWEKIIRILRERGEIEVQDSQHVGSLRGKDVVRAFSRDVKRMDLPFAVETDVSKGIIRRREAA